MGAPDIVDGGLTDALALRHGAATPVGHACRFGLQRRIHNSRDLVDWILRFSSPASRDVPQTIQGFFPKAFPPQPYRVAVHRKSLRDDDVGLAGSRAQNDTAA